MTHKNCPRYDLECVWWDVKPYSTLPSGTSNQATTNRYTNKITNPTTNKLDLVKKKTQKHTEKAKLNLNQQVLGNL